MCRSCSLTAHTNIQKNTVCAVCGKSFTTGYGQKAHQRVHKGTAGFLRNGHAWNKGLTAVTTPALRKTDEQRRAQSERLKQRPNKRKETTTTTNMGGYRRGAGRGKKGWYKGYWCDSSWELAWVIYHIDHGCQFTRCTEHFLYTFNGKQHKYFPDFKLDNGSYVEIKGWDTGNLAAKLRAVPGEIILVTKEEMRPILTFVVTKYGRDFVRLYSVR